LIVAASAAFVVAATVGFTAPAPAPDAVGVNLAFNLSVTSASFESLIFGLLVGFSI
jgi:hypothetical protein